VDEIQTSFTKNINSNTGVGGMNGEVVRSIERVNNEEKYLKDVILKFFKFCTLCATSVDVQPLLLIILTHLKCFALFGQPHVYNFCA
jgi:hypothetical protein